MQTDPHSALNGTAHDRYEELVLRSLTEPLPYADRAALDAHLDACEQCRAALDEWRAISTAVKTAARKEAFSLPPLPLDRINRKESHLMILRPLPLAAAVAALILTAFVIFAAQPQMQYAAQHTASPLLVSTMMPAELGSGVATIIPRATSTQVPPEGTLSYVVREGDTLLAILLSPPFNYAADQINSDLLNRIYELNPNIQGINSLPQPGIMIFIPARIGAPYVEWEDYTIQPGDTLASILLSPPYNFSLAQITPELMNEIVRLNPGMDASGALPDVGETIRIPFPTQSGATSGDPLFMTATAVVQQVTDDALGAGGIDPLALTATQIIQEATATALGAVATATPLGTGEIDPLALTATQIIQEATATALGAVATATPLGTGEIDPLALTATQIIQEATATALGAVATATATPIPLAAGTVPAGWMMVTASLDRITLISGVPLRLDSIVNVAVSRHNPDGIGTDEYVLMPISQEARVIALDETAVTVALPAAQAELLIQAVRESAPIYMTVLSATPAPRPT